MEITKSHRMHIFLVYLIALALAFHIAVAAFVGPTVTQVSNSTRTIAANVTVNGSEGGGYIYTINLNGLEQNNRWKAYVGNVSGTLTLDDANSYTIYDWNLGAVSGEIYAARNNSPVNFTGLNCTWAATYYLAANATPTNRTIEDNENSALSHTRLDNITATFSQRNHSAVQVGDTIIAANPCYAIRPFVNDTNQTASTYFDEVIMYDGRDSGKGNVVYVAKIENDVYGYKGTIGNTTYDFQLVIPENGASGFTSATSYYFYVELT